MTNTVRYKLFDIQKAEAENPYWSINSVPMKAIPYKSLYIFVKVQPERTTRNTFKVAAGIYPNPKETPVMRSWLAIKEFASEEAAYQFGLQEARAWIDEHEWTR